jgi:hypothetical protein
MLVRVPIIINFVLLLLLIGPGSSHRLYLASKRAGVANLIGPAIQIWVVVATLFATAIFIWMRFKKSDEEPQQSAKGATFDGVLLLGWWIVLIFLCLYAFSLGMGG